MSSVSSVVDGFKKFCKTVGGKLYETEWYGGKVVDVACVLKEPRHIRLSVIAGRVALYDEDKGHSEDMDINPSEFEVSATKPSESEFSVRLAPCDYYSDVSGLFDRIHVTYDRQGNKVKFLLTRIRKGEWWWR